MASEKFSNKLSDAQLERLAILSEEMGEAQQIIGKIIRHGYESKDPTIKDSETNHSLLEKELGDVRAAIQLMVWARDVPEDAILRRIEQKLIKIGPYLHHQPEHVYAF